MPKSVLLMSAAIDTSPQMGNNLRSNSALRRKDYRDALSYYLKALPAEVEEILFLDNTAADLADFDALRIEAGTCGKQLSLASFKGKTPASLGKGVCEFEILDTASEWLSERFDPETVIWKVTGRLQVKNIVRLIRSRPRAAEIYVDMRSVPFIGERLGGNDWAEMRVMCYTLGAYSRHLAGRGRSFGYVTEKGLFSHLQGLRMRGEATIAPRFRVQPLLRGICGGSNKSYESLEYRTKDIVRSLSRTFVPSLWL